MEPQDKVDPTVADAANHAETLDPADPDRAADDAPDGDEESLRGDPVDATTDELEAQIDAFLAEGEDDPEPAPKS